MRKSKEKFNELILINDGKAMLRSVLQPSNKFVAHFSTDKGAILVQEILFEKTWNEVATLDRMDNK